MWIGTFHAIGARMLRAALFGVLDGGVGVAVALADGPDERCAWAALSRCGSSGAWQPAVVASTTVTARRTPRDRGAVTGPR